MKKKKQIDKMVDSFEKKWRQDYDTGFLKPVLHIDDVRELIEKVLKIK